jgi:hypothetical protein
MRHFADAQTPFTEAVMKRIVWAFPVAFILAGCQNSIAPEALAPEGLSASNSPSVICTASVPPQCEVKVKPPKR